MKRIYILIAGLCAGAVLAVSLVLTVNPAGAQDMPDSDQDVIEEVILPESQATAADPREILELIVTPRDSSDQLDEAGVISITIAFDETADLPKREPAIWGVLLESSDNSLVIRSSPTSLVNGKRTCQPTEGGKQTNVLLSGESRFVEDITDFNQAEPVTGPNDLFVSQILKDVQRPVKFPKCTSVLIWGEWDGDQLVADVILFHDELR